MSAKVQTKQILSEEEKMVNSRYVVIILVSLILTSFLSFLSPPPVSAAEADRYFTVEFQQDGKYVPVKDHLVKLKKKPFTMIFLFHKPGENEVSLNACTYPLSYDMARLGYPLKEIPGFSEYGSMAEWNYNEKKSLFLSRKATLCWYYKDRSDNRFDFVGEENGDLVCKRDVAQLMDRDNSRDLFPIEKLKEDQIYLVFVRADWDKDFKLSAEKQREYIKIQFE